MGTEEWSMQGIGEQVFAADVGQIFLWYIEIRREPFSTPIDDGWRRSIERDKTQPVLTSKDERTGRKTGSYESMCDSKSLWHS